MDLKKYIYYKCRAIKVHVLAFIAPRKLADYYYKNIFGRSINWESPQDLNEWINVLMHSSDTSMWTILADKYRVRQYIEKKGLSHILVPLLGVWDNPDKIEIDKLPDQFVIKSNNGNETVLLVDKNVYIPDLKSITKLWLRKKFGRTQCEPHYTKIPPLIIAEKMLDTSKQDIVSTSLIDYKIWCINGKPQCVMTFHDRNKKTVTVNLFDTQWNRHNEDLVFGDHFICGDDIPKPNNLNEMLEIATILSEGFPQVRVDLYNVDNQIYFGEMTFSSNGGRMEYFSQRLLKELGDKISISC